MNQVTDQMLIRLIQLPLIILTVCAVVRFTLYRLDCDHAELERLGHPFSLWNWLNLPALRREHKRRREQSSRDFFHSLASHSLAKAAIEARMEAEGLTFEEAARAVILGKEPSCNS